MTLSAVTFPLKSLRITLLYGPVISNVPIFLSVPVLVNVPSVFLMLNPAASKSPFIFPSMFKGSPLKSLVNGLL